MLKDDGDLPRRIEECIQSLKRLSEDIHEFQERDAEIRKKLVTDIKEFQNYLAEQRYTPEAERDGDMVTKGLRIDRASKAAMVPVAQRPQTRMHQDGK